MLRLLLIFGVLLLLGNAQAQQSPPEGYSEEFGRALESRFSYSVSRQFIVHSQARTGWLPAVGRATNIVRLEPNLLAVSCERIKRALMKELGVSKDDWRGRISVELHPARRIDENIQIASTWYADGWRYRVDVPDAVEESRLISALVQVLLLETANRNSSGRSAEMPAWLVRGLTQQLIRTADAELILQSVEHRGDGLSVFSMRSGRKANQLSNAHAELNVQSPLTLEELSWPRDGQFVGAAGEAYDCSAQVFVCKLLQLDTGRDCLRNFLNQLPQRLNWQIAFLQVFRDYFATQRDLEKWWALQIQNFTERDLAQIWPKDTSWRKLAEIVSSQVEVRMTTNDLPMRTEVSLQTIIREWDYPRQRSVLREKLEQLVLLRMHVSAELVPLVDGYRQAVEKYLRNCDKVAVVPLAKGMKAPKLAVFVKETVGELDALTARMEELRPKPEPKERRKNDAPNVAVFN